MIYNFILNHTEAAAKNATIGPLAGIELACEADSGSGRKSLQSLLINFVPPL
jgi:hypothetical protein